MDANGEYQTRGGCLGVLKICGIDWGALVQKIQSIYLKQTFLESV